MSLYVRALLTGIGVYLLTITALAKGPKPSYEDGVITGDIVSVILNVDPDGVITVDGTEAVVTMGVGVRGWTEVELWLSANILEIDGDLLYSHAYGEEPLWPSGEDPPLWIGEEPDPGDPYIPPDFSPSQWLDPVDDTDLGSGRYYFGNARLIKGENDSRFDFDFSPHGPCTSPAFGERVPPVSAEPDDWAEWRANGQADSPPVCPFMLVLLGGQEDSNGNVTFSANPELFLVRKGGYPRVMLEDFTLGPLCPEGDIPEGGCVKPGGFTVGTGPVENPIVFDFSQN